MTQRTITYDAREAFEKWLSDEGYASSYAGDGQYESPAQAMAYQAWLAAAPQPEAVSQPAASAEPVAPWRAHQAAIDAKAMATAQEIALMWGNDRSQFVSRIQLAVMDAMRWVCDSAPVAARAREEP